jgi:(2Fe-2S) ferredoxin
MADGPRLLVSVCKGSECCARGAEALFEEIHRAVEAGGAEARVKVTRGGCWGLCNLGANVVVRQDAAALAVERNVFGGDASFAGKVGEYCYGGMTVEAAQRVVDEHLLGGRPARDLLLTAEMRLTAVKLSKD